jgi:hypothetical protein
LIVVVCVGSSGRISYASLHHCIVVVCIDFDAGGYAIRPYIIDRRRSFAVSFPLENRWYWRWARRHVRSAHGFDSLDAAFVDALAYCVSPDAANAPAVRSSN